MNAASTQARNVEGAPQMATGATPANSLKDRVIAFIASCKQFARGICLDRNIDGSSIFDGAVVMFQVISMVVGGAL